MSAKKSKKVSTSTPLDRAWLKSEFRSMTDEDFMLGGPRKMLTRSQFARTYGYNVKTGKKTR